MSDIFDVSWDEKEQLVFALINAAAEYRQIFSDVLRQKYTPEVCEDAARRHHHCLRLIEKVNQVTPN